MTFQVYVFAPDAELIDELDELDEAIARCEELVHEDGYRVAEIWDSAGDRVHSVGRSGDWTSGASHPDAAATSEPAPPFGFAAEREPDADAPDPEAAPIDDGEPSASAGALAPRPTRDNRSPEPAAPVATAPSPEADGATLTDRPPLVIDNAAAAPVQWFGA